MGTGFCLLYMRLEVGSFSWPRATAQAAELTEEQFRHLMLGFGQGRPGKRCDLQSLGNHAAEKRRYFIMRRRVCRLLTSCRKNRKSEPHKEFG